MPFDRHRSSRRLPVLGILAAGLAFAGSCLMNVPATATPSAPATSPTSQTSSSSTSARPPSTSKPNRATFGVGPAPLSKTDTRSLFSFQIAAGSSFSDQVALLNYATTPVSLIVFAADLGNASDGGLTAGLQSQRAVDAGSWVRLPKPTQTVLVPARVTGAPGRVVLPFTIKVPANASPGDHGAAIVATLSTLGKNPQGQNVRLDQRLATRVYVRVSGAAAPALIIENLKASYHPKSNPFAAGSAIVSYTVRNSGNVKLGGHQVVAVTGMFGTKAAAANLADLGLLFPGASVKVQVEVAGVQATGWQKVRVTLAPLVTADETTIHAVTVQASASFTAWPWAELLAVIILLAMLGAGYGLRRRRKRRKSTAGRHGGGPAFTKLPEVVGS